jgi:hypothetical protein
MFLIFMVVRVDRECGRSSTTYDRQADAIRELKSSAIVWLSWKRVTRGAASVSYNWRKVGIDLTASRWSYSRELFPDNGQTGSWRVARV